MTKRIWPNLDHIEIDSDDSGVYGVWKKQDKKSNNKDNK